MILQQRLLRGIGYHPEPAGRAVTRRVDMAIHLEVPFPLVHGADMAMKLLRDSSRSSE